jgi:hypothetical protein
METLFSGGTIGKVGVGVQAFHRLGHDVGRGVAENFQFLIFRTFRNMTVVVDDLHGFTLLLFPGVCVQKNIRPAFLCRDGCWISIRGSTLLVVKPLIEPRYRAAAAFHPEMVSYQGLAAGLHLPPLSVNRYPDRVFPFIWKGYRQYTPTGEENQGVYRFLDIPLFDSEKRHMVKCTCRENGGGGMKCAERLRLYYCL